MKRRTGIIISIVLGAVVLVGLGMLGVIVYLRAPLGGKTPEVIIPTTMFVTLTRPFDGSRPALGESVPVAAQGVGVSPVQSLELWVDGELVNRTVTQMPELKQLNAFWNWIPDSEGSHTLTARAVDAQGKAILSNSVRVRVGPPPPVVISILPKSGDTLDSLTAAYNLPPLAVADENPAVADPTAPLSVDQPVNLPFVTGSSLPPGWHPAPEFDGPANPPAPIPPAPPPAPAPPGGNDSTPPSPPDLSVTLNGCQIIAAITAASDNADGFKLFMLKPGPVTKNELVGQIGPMSSGKQAEIKIDNNFGEYTLFAQAFNSAGTSESLPVNVSVLDGNCAANDPSTGEIKLITVEKINRIYCYVTIDKLTYIRVPSLEDAYIEAMSPSELEAFKGRVLKYGGNLAAGSGFDMAPYLPQIYPKGSGTSDIKFDCSNWDSQSEIGVAEKLIKDEELGKFTIVSSQKFSVLGIFGTPNAGAQSYVTIPAPKNLRTTGDPKLCAQNLDDGHNIYPDYDFCSIMIMNGNVAFVWDYSQPSPGFSLCMPGAEKWCTTVTDIDGFRLYRVIDNTGNMQVASTTTLQDKSTAAFAPWPVNDQICFTVRAYKGSVESSNSNTVCLTWDQKDTTGTKMIDIYPSSLGVDCVTEKEIGIPKAGYCSTMFNAGEKNDGPLTIGHFESYIDSDYELVYFGSGIIRFKNLAGPNMVVSDVMGKPVLSARLKFQMTQFKHLFEKYISQQPCPSVFGVLKNGYNSAYTTVQHPVHPLTWDEISIDVTEIVKGWAQGQPNFGFALDGRHGGSFALAEYDLCEASYDNFRLEVIYFPNQ